MIIESYLGITDPQELVRMYVLSLIAQGLQNSLSCRHAIRFFSKQSKVEIDIETQRAYFRS